MSLGAHTAEADCKLMSYILEIQAAGTLSDAAGPEASTGTVRGASVEGCTWSTTMVNLMCGDGAEERAAVPMKAISYLTSSLARHG